jgi:hypothetical protein
MRKKIVLLILTLIQISSFSQDIIVKRNGDEIKSKVLEITTETIKYKGFDFQDGPTRNIKISDVFMIIYENGKREKFTTTEDLSIKNKMENISGNYFSIATGYGNSYGGIGLKLQYVTPGNVRVGIHGGIGYFPSLGGWLLFSGGVQIYFWDYLYVDAQLGAFGAYEDPYFVDDGFGGWVEYESGRLFGPSLLLGYDWFITDHFGFNIATGASLDVDHYNNEIFYAVDAGLIVKF